MSPVKIVYTLTAEDDLDSIFNYIAKNSIDNALNYLKKIKFAI